MREPRHTAEPWKFSVGQVCDTCLACHVSQKPKEPRTLKASVAESRKSFTSVENLVFEIFLSIFYLRG